MGGGGPVDMPDDINFTDITREQFKLYQEIQMGGDYNMMDWRGVEIASDYELDRATQLTIHKYYEELAAKYD